jgi:hypothetical protein
MGKNLQLKKIGYFFDKKLQFSYPQASIKDAQATEKPSALQKEHPALQTMKILEFFSIFVGNFCPPGFVPSNSN